MLRLHQQNLNTALIRSVKSKIISECTGTGVKLNWSEDGERLRLSAAEQMLIVSLLTDRMCAAAWQCALSWADAVLIKHDFNPKLVDPYNFRISARSVVVQFEGRSRQLISCLNDQWSCCPSYILVSALWAVPQSDFPHGCCGRIRSNL